MDVYSMVTERIIKQLEAGYIPWRKPWVNCRAGSFNRISRNPYSLMNQILLQHDGEYATFRQWEEIGGRIKKGEKSEIVVFWKMQEKKVDEGEENDKIRQIPILRYYNVFHISQVENVLPLPPEEPYPTEPISEAEAVLHEYVGREKIKLHIGKSNQAFYRLSDDSITLPGIDQFAVPQEYYSTAFHEAIHSTMKAGRCDREEENKNSFFGNDDYSKEELTAEIGSAAMLNCLGIETDRTFENNAAYIQSWLRVLQNDKRFIISASGKAEKAVRYILNAE